MYVFATLLSVNHTVQINKFEETEHETMGNQNDNKTG